MIVPYTLKDLEDGHLFGHDIKDEDGRRATETCPLILCEHVAHNDPNAPGPHSYFVNHEGTLVLSVNTERNRWGLWDRKVLESHFPRSAGTQVLARGFTPKENPDMPTVRKSAAITPWNLVEFALDARCPRSLIYGPPGTGKTMSAFLWAKEHKFECLSTTLTEDTPMTELRGHFVLKGQDFVWHDGLVARAWRMSLTTPVLVILNEIDHASGDTSTFLHNALDDPEMARLDLPNDETLTPNPGHVMYVATMNGVPEDLSEALRDRFPVKVHIPHPNPAAIKGLPKNLQTFGENLASRPGVTLRGLYEFARMLKCGCKEEMAARLIFGDAAPDLLNALKLAE